MNKVSKKKRGGGRRREERGREEEGGEIRRRKGRRRGRGRNKARRGCCGQHVTGGFHQRDKSTVPANFQSGLQSQQGVGCPLGIVRLSPPPTLSRILTPLAKAEHRPTSVSQAAGSGSDMALAMDKGGSWG